METQKQKNQKAKHNAARQRAKVKRDSERAANRLEYKSAVVPAGLRYTSNMLAAFSIAAKNRRAAGLPAPKPSAWDIEVAHSPYLDRPRKAMRKAGYRYSHETGSWEATKYNARVSA